jgi:glutamine amidotransferase
MNLITVGIVDYGIGNHASVIHSLRDLGFHVRVSAETEVLDSVDVMLLPGVGAFPSAMQALHQRGLVGYLQEQAREQRPILGVCLGMQLLASASHEHHYTAGLDIIPGEVLALAGSKWHIGWNTVECVELDPLLQASDGQAFYFNHSYYYQCSTEYQVCLSRHPEPFASVVRRGRVVGVQFHPEKSQTTGRALLENLITGLVNA